MTGKLNRAGGSGSLNLGRRNQLEVPVFSNGGKAAGRTDVVVHEGSATGPVVARKTVSLGKYQRNYVKFAYKSNAEGALKLVTVVDPCNTIKEGSEQNQTQVTNLWVGPRKPRVLVVDDDQVLSHEQAVEGALASLGVPYAVVQAHPSARTLAHYQAVIWSSGVDRYEGQVNAGDRAAIASYLDKGGKLLFTGNRIMDALSTVGSPQAAGSEVPFGAHYFGVRTPSGNTSYVVSQPTSVTVAGAAILARQKIKIHPSPARQFVGLAGLSAAGPGFSGDTIKPYGRGCRHRHAEPRRCWVRSPRPLIAPTSRSGSTATRRITGSRPSPSAGTSARTTTPGPRSGWSAACSSTSGSARIPSAR